MIIQKPFVVIGDEPPDMVRERSEETVKWAVDKLKASFFAKDPERHPRHLALPGQGQLREARHGPLRQPAPHALRLLLGPAQGPRHEHRHRRRHAGPRDRPPLHGRQFPRLPVLAQRRPRLPLRAMRRRRRADRGPHQLAACRPPGGDPRQAGFPPFKTLCSTTTAEFYDDPGGTNYAQARYLCYYLQEHDLLRKFYREFRARAADDPTGYNTLVALLGHDDMAQFQTDWEAYVLKLRFP